MKIIDVLRMIEIRIDELETLLEKEPENSIHRYPLSVGIYELLLLGMTITNREKNDMNNNSEINVH